MRQISVLLLLSLFFFLYFFFLLQLSVFIPPTHNKFQKWNKFPWQLYTEAAEGEASEAEQLYRKDSQAL